MDPRTRRDPGPGQPAHLQPEPLRAPTASARWRNRAVADAYEPGSMFKIFTAAAALQEKVVDARRDHRLRRRRRSRSRGIRINDHARLRRPQLPRRDRQVQRHRRDPRGAAPGARELQPLHARLRLRRRRPASSCRASRAACCGRRPSGARSRCASLSFGQEIGVTALQMATAVARGGERRLPDEAADRAADRGQRGPRGEELPSPWPCGACSSPRRSTRSPTCCAGVVTSGTGRRAAIPGYVVAGKTGTAQKVDAQGRYSMVDHVASFVGFVPASRPALVVLVSLDTPEGRAQRGRRRGGAGLRARRRAGAAPPRGAARRHGPRPAHGAVPTRRADACAPTGRRAASDARAGGATRRDSDPRLMPDLRGRSAREAAIAAARRGLIVELKGRARSSPRVPEPGTEIEAGHDVRPDAGARADEARRAGGAVSRARVLDGEPGTGRDRRDPRLAQGPARGAVRGDPRPRDRREPVRRRRPQARAPWPWPRRRRRGRASPGSGCTTRARRSRPSRPRSLGRSGRRASTLVGVTGTNGKTTTAYLIDAALRAAGTARGPARHRPVPDRRPPSRGRAHDTRVLGPAEAVPRDGGRRAARHAVLEVSSHSLALKRVHGCAFQVAVFTNLTRDHLDFHGDMDALLRRQAGPLRHAAARGRTRHRERRRRPRARSWLARRRGRVTDLRHRSRRPTSGPRRSRSRSTGTSFRAAHARRRLRAPDAAARPLQRPEPAGGASGPAWRSASPPRRRSAGSASLARRAGAAGARGRRPGLHRDRGLRPHRRRAQEPAGDGARAEAAPRDHRLRLRRRPRPDQAPADGRRGRRGSPTWSS